ncbi:MAG: C39 family peptidase [Gemmatimonadetes bacterium]|nr:C39 family peptidase [Gemmatimonadota bacterium]
MGSKPGRPTPTAPANALPDKAKLRRLIVRAEDRTDESAIARELPVHHFVQPDDVTCGPTCLRKVYDYYGIDIDDDVLVDAIERNEDGGTLAVFLGMAAMRHGLSARIYSYDLQIFDPTWTNLPRAELIGKIRARSPYLTDAKRRGAAVAYVRYLEKGGELAFDELTPALLKSIVDRGHPVLAGLSATYLYGFARERWDEVGGRLVDDDVAGDPTGHFIVVSGYDQWGRRLTVLDPSEHVPATPDGRLIVSAERLINSILLGDVTYDAVLLELWPANEQEENA